MKVNENIKLGNQTGGFMRFIRRNSQFLARIFPRSELCRRFAKRAHFSHIDSLVFVLNLAAEKKNFPISTANCDTFPKSDESKKVLANSFRSYF
jgi:hypothetical protein